MTAPRVVYLLEKQPGSSGPIVPVELNPNTDGISINAIYLQSATSSDTAVSLTRDQSSGALVFTDTTNNIPVSLTQLLAVMAPNTIRTYNPANANDPPPASLGTDGDFAYNLANKSFYGPRTNGAYDPASKVSTIGLKGDKGDRGDKGDAGNPGAAGTIIYSCTGNGPPSNAIGTAIDYAFNTAEKKIYGPKGGPTWPTVASVDLSTSGGALQNPVVIDAQGSITQPPQLNMIGVYSAADNYSNYLKLYCQALNLANGVTSPVLQLQAGHLNGVNNNGHELLRLDHLYRGYSPLTHDFSTDLWTFTGDFSLRDLTARAATFSSIVRPSAVIMGVAPGVNPVVPFAYGGPGFADGQVPFQLLAPAGGAAYFGVGRDTTGLAACFGYINVDSGGYIQGTAIFDRANKPIVVYVGNSPTKAAIFNPDGSINLGVAGKALNIPADVNFTGNVSISSSTKDPVVTVTAGQNPTLTLAQAANVINVTGTTGIALPTANANAVGVRYCIVIGAASTYADLYVQSGDTLYTPSGNYTAGQPFTSKTQRYANVIVECNALNSWVVIGVNAWGPGASNNLPIVALGSGTNTQLTPSQSGSIFTIPSNGTAILPAAALGLSYTLVNTGTSSCRYLPQAGDSIVFRGQNLGAGNPLWLYTQGAAYYLVCTAANTWTALVSENATGDSVTTVTSGNPTLVRLATQNLVNYTATAAATLPSATADMVGTRFLFTVSANNVLATVYAQTGETIYTTSGTYSTAQPYTSQGLRTSALLLECNAAGSWVTVSMSGWGPAGTGVQNDNILTVASGNLGLLANQTGSVISFTGNGAATLPVANASAVGTKFMFVVNADSIQGGVYVAANGGADKIYAESGTITEGVLLQSQAKRFAMLYVECTQLNTWNVIVARAWPGVATVQSVVALSPGTNTQATAGQSGSIFTIPSNGTLILPPAAVGLSYTFINTGTSSCRFLPQGADTIYYQGTTYNAGGPLYLYNAGAAYTAVCVAANTWYITGAEAGCPTLRRPLSVGSNVTATLEMSGGLFVMNQPGTLYLPTADVRCIGREFTLTNSVATNIAIQTQAGDTMYWGGPTSGVNAPTNKASGSNYLHLAAAIGARATAECVAVNQYHLTRLIGTNWT